MKIKIEKLIFEGFGLGREFKKESADDYLNNKPVFVRKAVPDDLLEVKIIKDKKSYAEAKIEKIIEPGSLRTKAQCQYFDKCGGCEHQNINYEDQLKIKGGIFAETLRRQGITLAPEKIIAGSDQEFFYRNSIRFFFLKKTGTNYSPNSKISFARHNYLYNEGLVEAESCLLQSETANEILAALRDFINNNIEHKSSFWQLKIREGKFTGEFMVEIITSDESLPGEKGIVEVLKNISGVKSVYHTIAPAKSLKKLRRRLIFGSPIIYEKIGKYKFQISPESFFQTNSLGVKTLYDKIKEFAGINFGDNILDLYCGTGTIGIYLSTLAKKVVGVEVVPEAIRDAKDNAKINNVHNCEFINFDATKIRNLTLGIRNFDAIILDPPRAGLSKELIHKLSTISHKRIIYISCNPATFARDIKEFANYNIELKKVQPIDMFPQTHHIECVGVLEKN